jgi:hypothetical protein
MINNPLLAIWKITKSNSAALIIGAAIIVGLNLPLFLSGAQSLWYEISGQAAREREESGQAMRLQTKGLHERKIMTEAWNSFLLASRGNDNPEIKVVKDTSGDFICLDDLISGQDRKDHFADMFIKYLNQNAILGRNDWQYEMLDNNFFSDAYTAGQSNDIKYRKGYGFAPCEVPKYLHRRNRYQQHIE